MRITALIVGGIGVCTLLARTLPVLPGMSGIANYLPLHMLLETFAIVVAMLIFAVGWHAHNRNLPGNITLLACAFFGVGLLDFLHMLSYAGMPDFMTPSHAEKSIDFWLAARLLAAASLLAAVTMPWRPFASGATRYKLLGAVCAATALAFWLFTFHQEEMPRTFIPGQGLTAFKLASEYFFIALNLATALMLWKRMRDPLPFNAAALFGAVCAMALSGFMFTLYASVTDIYNLLGHVYKAVAYLFLYRAIFVSTVEIPYHQLQISRAKLRSTLDAIPDLVWLKNADGVYLECNPVFERLYGARKADIIGKTDYDFVDRELADFFREHDRKAAVANRPSVNEEWLTFAEDGYRGLFETVKTPMRDEAGKLIGVLGLARDITARNDGEAKIERLSRTYRLLSRVNEAIVRAGDRRMLFDAVCHAAIESGLFRFVWVGMLDETWVIPVAHAGAEDGYLSGKFNIVIDDERTGNGPTGRAIREGGHVISQDIEHDPGMALWRDDALLRGYRASAAFPIREGGLVVGAVNIYAAEAQFFTPDIVELMLELAADISFALNAFAERERRERAEAEIRQLNAVLEQRVAERTYQFELVNRELEAFCYSVSHDLRAPLRSIDGFSQVLLRKYHGQLDMAGKGYLERVRRATQRMGRLIDDMLHLSQVTRGALKRDLVDLSAIAQQIADELRKSHPERKVEFVLRQGMVVHGDAGLLRIALGNLLGNAWKYTGKKGVAKIEFGACDIGGAYTFFVRDNGAGFDMQYAHKLFGAFQRLHGASEFDGTGIGLATVQRIVHRHQGRIWAEAEDGLGATFYFTLPQRERENDEAA